MAEIQVHGATLAGLASATRLAKVGHRVTVVTAGQPLGGHWVDPSANLDFLPQTLSLRAAWMDLFRKTGRAFDLELARHKLTLVPAPPVLHRFSDGLELTLPSERGAQFHAVADRLGQLAAQRWSELLDRADAIWRALRFAGLERPWPTTVDAATKNALWAHRSLNEVADQLGEPHLAQLVRDLGPLAGSNNNHQSPALLLSRAAMDRQFGQWQLVNDAGTAQPSGVLIDLLVQRLSTRKVRLAQDADDLPAPDAVLLATPTFPEGWLARRRSHPAWAPQVSHRIEPAPADQDAHEPGIQQVIEHTDAGPIVRWRRPLADGQLAVLTHDHTQARPDLQWGLSPASWRAWTVRPGLRARRPASSAPNAQPAWMASVCSPAGNEPWAELLSAALACYDLHEQLTGQDIRPTNTARRSD